MYSTVYINGEFRPADHAHVSIADLGLLYGLGFFETFRTTGGRPHHWKYHQQRLLGACQRATLHVPESCLALSEPRMSEVVRELLVRNAQTDAVFRYTVTAGANDAATEILTMRSLPAPTGDTGIRLRVLKLRRDSGEWWPRPKSLNYTNAFLGGKELESRGAARSDEGLFLSQHDEMIVETPRQNLVWIANDCIQTPDRSTGAVAGTCLAWMHEIGIAIQPVRAKLADMLRAEAVVCINSVRGITPVTELWDQEDRQILQTYPSNKHPFVGELQQKWSAALLQTSNQSG